MTDWKVRFPADTPGIPVTLYRKITGHMPGRVHYYIFLKSARDILSVNVFNVGQSSVALKNKCEKSPTCVQKCHWDAQSKAAIEKFPCSRHPPDSLLKEKTRFSNAVKSRKFEVIMFPNNFLHLVITQILKQLFL